MLAAACRGSPTRMQRTAESPTPPDAGERSASGETENAEPGTKRAYKSVRATKHQKQTPVFE